MKLLVSALFFFLKILPLPVYYFIGNCLFYVTYYFIKYRRDIVYQNISRSFPDFDEIRIRKTEKEFYRHLSDYFVEIAAIASLKPKSLRKRLKYLNADLPDQYLNSGKNILILAGHYGNWEWLCTMPRNIKHRIYSLYKPLRSHFAEEFISRVREKHGMSLLPYPGLYKEIISLLPNKKVSVLMLADQRPPWDDNAIWIEFMNQPITCFRGIENIFKVMQAVALFAKISKVKRGHYTVEFIPLEDNQEENRSGLTLTEKYFKELGKCIHADPAYYLWTHKRWKFTHPDLRSSPPGQ